MKISVHQFQILLSIQEAQKLPMFYVQEELDELEDDYMVRKQNSGPWCLTAKGDQFIERILEIDTV